MPERFGIACDRIAVMVADPRPSRDGLRLNTGDLVVQVVQGQIAHPVGRASPYRVGHDGVSRILPGTGGIVINRRIGDRCIGLAGDHIEPGVALHNNGREIIGPRDGPNMALLTSACVGNVARVVSGPCTGQVGIVTGKHGGINHVLVDFSTNILMRLNIGDRIQIYAIGPGVRLIDYPAISVSNAAPGLLRRWRLRQRAAVLEVPVTHVLPASLVGSGLGKNTVWRGDFDIQLADRSMRRRYGLETLRFGDLVAIEDEDGRFGASLRRGRMTMGVVVHSDSTVSGHGPGVTALLTGPAASLRPIRDSHANIAALYGRVALAPQRRYTPLAARQTMTMTPRAIAEHGPRYDCKAETRGYNS